MDAKLKQKWITALRSGEYTQTDRVLCTSDINGKPYFCVLGVLSEVAGLARKYDKVQNSYSYQFGPRSSNCHVPSPVFIKKIRLPLSKVCELYKRNDSSYTFTELADYIEDNL